MANVKEIEEYLSDLDNLIETGHFQDVSVRDYTFYHKEFKLPEIISKGREYIRQLCMIHKGIADKRPNEVTEALLLHSVVQQRELLTAFMEYLEAIPEFPEDDVLIENFIVEGGL